MTDDAPVHAAPPDVLAPRAAPRRWTPSATAERSAYLLNVMATRLIRPAYPPDAVVSVTGSTRSGTTWLAEMINHTGSYRYVFEPLDPNRSRRLSAMYQRYVPPDTADPALVEPVRALFEGRTFARRVDLYNRARLAPRHKLLVKFVFANLSLPWMVQQFPHVRFVHIVRDPFAVIASRLRLGWNTSDLDTIMSQPDLVNSHLGPYLELIDGARTPAERHVVLWCVENLIPATAFDHPNVLVVRYEHLVADPAGGFERIFAHIGEPWGPERLANVRRPSRTTWANTKAKSGFLTTYQRDAAADVIDAFGLTALGHDPR